MSLESGEMEVSESRMENERKQGCRASIEMCQLLPLVLILIF